MANVSRSASRTPTSETSMAYSTEEIEEMKSIFNQYDKDKSGHLNAHEFTQSLQLMDYKYNEDFVIAILKLVFDQEWEQKKDNLIFDDFLDFMSEFEPVHYEVIEKIEEKIKQHNITDIETDDPRITNLLKYIHFKNGTLLLHDIDQHLDELKTEKPPSPQKPSKSPNKLGMQSPFKKQAPLSPTLPSIVENNKDQLTETLTVHNAERFKEEISDQLLEEKTDDADLTEISNKLLAEPYEEELLNQDKYILKMNNDELIEWLNTDQAFNTTMIRRECCQIIKAQSWNGNDMMQALKLNKMDEILVTFKSIENYQYIIQSLESLNPSDIDCKELLTHLEMIKNQAVEHQEPEQQQSEQQQSEKPQPMRMELQPPSPQQAPQLSQMRTLSMTSKGIIDKDDELYTQNVWKQILRFFDENNDGTISIDEMAPALRSLGIDVSDNKLKEMINKMDTDQSGTIDYQEFKQYYHTLFQQKIKKGLDWKYIQNSFEKYDADSSGFLDIDEFSYALKKIASNITNQDIKSILHLMDSSGDLQIEFDEFVAFLESGHPKADWVLKKLIRASIPSPMEYLVAFKGLPQHFRKSELAELAQHNSFKISEWIKPRIDSDGVTLKNIKINPKTSEIKPKFKGDAIRDMEENNDESDSKQNFDNQHLQNMRLFKISECSGVALPDPSIASRIVDRKVRVCLYSNGKPISNVFTIPASWKFTEEDQWKFGSNIWKETMSHTVSEWNTFCVAIEQNVNHKIELFIELCITLKPSTTPKSQQFHNQIQQQQQLQQQQQQNPPKSPISPQPSNQFQQQSPFKNMPRSPMGMQQQQNQRQFNFHQNANAPKSGYQATNTEMCCGWAKLEIRSADWNISNGINMQHKLKIHGGTFDAESDIKNEDIRNDRRSSLSFRKLRQAISGVESVVVIQEQSYNNIRNTNKSFMKWVPENVITTVNSCKIIKLYYELMADEWLRDKQIFQFQFYKQNLYQTLLLYIIDRPNLLCILIDEWKAKCSTFWRGQKKDNKFMSDEFKGLLKQFVPFLVHQNLVEKEMESLNQERLSFIRQIVKGNVKQILNGNKPNSSVSLVYTPFTTDLFV